MSLETRNTSFGLDLYNKLLLREAEEGRNSIFSPISILLVLKQIAAGSDQSMVEKILSFFHLESVEVLKEFTSQYPSKTYLIQSQGWYDRSLWVDHYFQKLLEDEYRMSLTDVDFMNQAVKYCSKVNEWVKETTNGFITEAIPASSVDDRIRVLIVNTLSFKGAWDEVLGLYTKDNNDFHLLDGTCVKVPFISSSRPQYVASFETFKVLRIVLKKHGQEKGLSLCIFLPNARSGLASMVNRWLSSEAGLLEKYIPYKRVQVEGFRFPRFRLSYGCEADEILKRLGLVLHGSGEVYLNNAGKSSVGEKEVLFKHYHSWLVNINEAVLLIPLRMCLSLKMEKTS